MTSSLPLEIIPLGGLGEFGMNLMVYRYGGDCLVVDAGMMFPGSEHLGVDVVVPNMEFLDDCGTIHAVLLTHGHEDHIGALPFLLARRDVPVYGSPYTLGLVRGRLAEHLLGAAPRLAAFPPSGTPLALGPFTVDTLPVSHSIPQSAMLVLGTPVGTVVHTADFKLDPYPLSGPGTDLAALARLGERGVLALLSDSTNADRPGFTASERTVGPALARAIGDAPGRVLVTTFSSNIHRLQQVIDAGAAHGRRFAIVGSSMEFHTEIAVHLGLLRVPAGAQISAERAMDLPPRQAVLLVTGSQGEPTSALARIAVDKHRDVVISEGDLVLHSARSIPGNDKSIGRMINHLLRRGASVVTGADAPIHVSGHPCRSELELLIHLLRPRFLVPIHGEYRQLVAHAECGRACGLPSDRVLVADSGDLLALTEDALTCAGRVPVGQVFIDGALDRVDVATLRDRRQIAGDGIVIAVVALHRESGTPGGPVEIASRGFVSDASEEDILEQARGAVAESLEETSREERADEGLLKAKIQAALRRFLRKRTQKRPLIIPVVVEL
ncbi:MAG TPA: ribonuclease J [Candidatus Polarisedimenticolaceae bacterium]|nr:ribonuclease J [Candidatus Polarisedimenticolaceae bacterium]